MNAESDIYSGSDKIETIKSERTNSGYIITENDFGDNNESITIKNEFDPEESVTAKDTDDIL